MQKRTIFIWDVHGCYDELIALCEKFILTSEDHLYFTGDIINKWPKSLEVVEWIQSRPNTWSVIGNHEYYVLTEPEDIPDKHITGEVGRWILGTETQERLRPLKDLLKDHKDWLLSLPHYIEKEDFILVHGWIHPELGAETPLEIATLIREHDGKPWYEHYTGAKPIIYGHWATDGLRIRPNTIWLDSGCVFGGHLSAYILETREIVQVRAHRVHKMPSHWKKLEWPQEI
jgi:hypothetical protein